MNMLNTGAPWQLPGRFRFRQASGHSFAEKYSSVFHVIVCWRDHAAAKSSESGNAASASRQRSPTTSRNNYRMYLA
jgi:hypothetical protein